MALVAYGQTPSATAVADWSALSVSDFCTQATAALAQTDVTDQVAGQIHAQATARLLNDATFATTSYENLLQLYQWGKSGLTAAQRSATVSRLAPPSDEVAGWNYWDVVSNFDQMRKAQLPADTCGAVVVAWLKAQQELDGVSLSDPDRLGYLSWMLDSLGTRATDFSVSWTGSVKAPYDGTYTFSICPIDVRRDGTTDVWVKEKMAVSVGGQQVLNAGTGDWTPDGTPVRLKAGQSTALQVNFSYSTTAPDIPQSFPAIARLSWQGPGVNKQLVPASALWSADGTQPGLSAQYSWAVYNADRGVMVSQTSTTTEPVIDHVWMSDIPIVTAYGGQHAWLAARVAALAVAPDYLAQLEANPTTPHFLLRATDSSDSSKNVLERSLLTMLSSSQQTAFAEALLARPALLGPASQAAIRQLYQSCLVAAPDTALQLFGKWAQMHPEAEPQFGRTCTGPIGWIITC